MKCALFSPLQFITTGLTSTSIVSANKVAVAILGTMDLELEVIFEHALTFGMKTLEEKNAKNRLLYTELMHDLTELLNTPQIRLKNFLIGHVFLSYFSKISRFHGIFSWDFFMEFFLGFSHGNF